MAFHVNTDASTGNVYYGFILLIRGAGLTDGGIPAGLWLYHVGYAASWTHYAYGFILLYRSGAYNYGSTNGFFDFDINAQDSFSNKDHGFILKCWSVVEVAVMRLLLDYGLFISIMVFQQPIRPIGFGMLCRGGDTGGTYAGLSVFYIKRDSSSYETLFGFILYCCIVVVVLIMELLMGFGRSLSLLVLPPPTRPTDLSVGTWWRSEKWWTRC